MTARRFVRLEELVGRKVRDEDGRTVGRIEEVVAELHGDRHEVVEYRLGSGALLDRLAVTRRLFGHTVRTIIVAWDQLDVRRVRHPRLLCPASELAIEEG